MIASGQHSRLRSAPKRAAVVVAGLLAGLAMTAAPASGAWGTGQPISEEDADLGRSTAPAVARAPNGTTLFAWSRVVENCCQQVQFRIASPAGALGPSRFLTPRTLNVGVDQIQVAVDSQGDFLVVWTRQEADEFTIQARAISAAGAIGPMKRVTKPNWDSFNPQADVDADGDAVIAWHACPASSSPPCGANFGSRVQARTLSAAGGLGGVHTLARTSNFADVAVDSDGDAAIVWLASVIAEGEARGRVQGAAISKSGVVTGPLNLSEAQNTNHFNSFPRIAVADNGAGRAVWQFQLNTGPYVIQSAAYSTAGGAGGAQTISAGTGYQEDPQVAVNASGQAAVTWQRTGDFGETFNEARRISAVGNATGIRPLGPPESSLTQAEVGIDDAGTAHFLWDNGTSSIRTRTLSAANVLGQTRILGGGNTSYALSVTPSGLAAATWTAPTTDRNVIGAFGP